MCVCAEKDNGEKGNGTKDNAEKDNAEKDNRENDNAEKGADTKDNGNRNESSVAVAAEDRYIALYCIILELQIVYNHSSTRTCCILSAIALVLSRTCLI